jgi:hypothetical protein
VSGKAAKRARREAERRSELKPDAIKNTNNSRFMQSLLRVKAKTLGYALAGTIAVAGALWTADRIPFLAGTRTKYNLTITFLNHDKTSDGAKFSGEISDRIKRGENIKIVFVESANLRETDYERYTLSLNESLSTGRNMYRSMLNRGMSQAQADRECLSRMATTTDLAAGFMRQLYLTAIKYDLVVMPIEGHTRIEVEQVNLAEAFIGKMVGRWDSLVKSNASLHDLMLNMKQLNDGLIRIYNGIQATRNKEIAQGIEGRFVEAERLFPQLRRQELKEHELNAIGYLGLNHTDVVRKFNPSNHKLRIRAEEYDETGPNSNDSIAARLKINVSNPDGTMSERTAYLAAIDRMWFISGMAELDKIGRHDIVEVGIGNALKMTTEQLEELDRQSSAISDPNHRLNFVLNRIIGMDIFRLK